MNDLVNHISDSFSRWIGSNASIVLHTIFFIACLIAPFLLPISSSAILLILTTIVSLEAIYLAIFIQRSVNEQADRLAEVEDSIDDVEEALDDVEEALDDVEEGLDDVEKTIQEDEGEEEDELKATIAELKALIKDLKQK